MSSSFLIQLFITHLFLSFCHFDFFSQITFRAILQEIKALTGTVSCNFCSKDDFVPQFRFLIEYLIFKFYFPFPFNYRLYLDFI